MKQTKKLRRKVISYVLALVMVFSTFTGIVPGMSLKAYAAPTETLLTTITPTGIDTYSESTKGVVNVTLSGIEMYDDRYGEGRWMRAGTVTVTQKEGYTITKCRFVKRTETVDDTEAPFSNNIDGNNYISSIEIYGYANKAAQTITVSDVTATYGDNDKSVSASVTTPATGGGAISYTVKDGSVDYIDVASDGKLTIKKVPPTDGKAYVIVKAAATDDYAETTKEVTVTISKAEATVAAKDQSIMVDGTVPDLSAPVLDTHYSVTGLVGTDTLTTAPTLAYEKDGKAATPDSATAGTYDIVPSGASAGDNYNISYTNGTLTISEKQPATVTKAPEAKTLTYTGSAQELVTAGTATGGEMQYALGTATEATEAYSTSIPTVTDVGTYYVWYKAVGDASHSDSEPGVVKVEIAKDDAAVDAVKKKIDALPASDKVTVNDKKAIEDARAAYDRLTDEQKKQIPAETVKKLEDVEKALAAAEAADKAAKELEAAKKEAQAAMNEQVTVTQKGKKITVKWKKAKSADGYYVYAQYCGKKFKKPVKNIKKNSITKLNIKKINGKKINLKKQFKVYVLTYKKVNGKKVVLAKSNVGHIVGVKNKKFTNVKTLKLKKKTYTVEVGKTANVKAKVTIVDKSKKHIASKHIAKFRYRTSDESIATVSKKGKIKGISKGKCTIYVYAANGKMKKATVTVK